MNEKELDLYLEDHENDDEELLRNIYPTLPISQIDDYRDDFLDGLDPSF